MVEFDICTHLLFGLHFSCVVGRIRCVVDVEVQLNFLAVVASLCYDCESLLCV